MSYWFDNLLSDGVHLCPHCRYRPNDERATTQDPHPCIYMEVMTSSFSEPPTGATLLDSGSGYYVTECRFYRPVERDYWRYLQSKQWQDTRKAVLYRDHYKCRNCGATRYLTVHHKTYSRFGHERLSDLITLCRRCHREVHRTPNIMRPRNCNFTPALIEEDGHDG